ncbi:hypothetical protein [Litoribacter ruber]|uniref:hypothetical protein n=1 Tax=Litoribacter ruber TaxID=702568 RepID=UPI001FE3F879|nr:hypothetical protein [Litoribacter alkaliphilus]
MIRRLKAGIWYKVLTYMLLVNFVNLSANFYHASEHDSSLLQSQDPIDSLAELMLEYVFDMDDETIPDTEVPHEKRKIADIKLLYTAELIAFDQFLPIVKSPKATPYQNNYKDWANDINSPPPKQG